MVERQLAVSLRCLSHEPLCSDKVGNATSSSVRYLQLGVVARVCNPASNRRVAASKASLGYGTQMSQKRKERRESSPSQGNFCVPQFPVQRDETEAEAVGVENGF